MTEPAQPIAYFNNTFVEAMALARDARDYLVRHEGKDHKTLSPTARLAACCESMRVTTRIAQIIAWLLVQKAIHAGEIAREEAAEARYRLGGQRVCAATAPFAGEAVPDRLAELLDRSHRLYMRVARLDALLDRENMNI